MHVKFNVSFKMGSPLPPATDFSSTEDAQNLLEVARASRNACRAQKSYVASKLQESLTLAQFYQFQLEQIANQLDEAEGWVGKIRAKMRHLGVGIRAGETSACKLEVRTILMLLLSTSNYI